MELLVASVCQAANCCSSAASGDEPSSHGNPSGEGDEVALMVWICKALANSASNGECFFCVCMCAKGGGV